MDLPDFGNFEENDSDLSEESTESERSSEKKTKGRNEDYEKDWTDDDLKLDEFQVDEKTVEILKKMVDKDQNTSTVLPDRPDDDEALENLEDDDAYLISWKLNYFDMDGSDSNEDVDQNSTQLDEDDTDMMSFHRTLPYGNDDLQSALDKLNYIPSSSSSSSTECIPNVVVNSNGSDSDSDSN